MLYFQARDFNFLCLSFFTCKIRALDYVFYQGPVLTAVLYKFKPQNFLSFTLTFSTMDTYQICKRMCFPWHTSQNHPTLQSLALFLLAPETHSSDMTKSNDSENILSLSSLALSPFSHFYLFQNSFSLSHSKPACFICLYVENVTTGSFRDACIQLLEHKM